MRIDTTYRLDALEIMDDFSLEGEQFRDALDKIAQINRFLGGNRATLQGVKTLLADVAKDRQITILDIGCGSGDMLRMLADFASKRNLDFNLIGIDANAFTARYAAGLCAGYSNIRIECLDIFEPGTPAIYSDISLATLTLHHFDDAQIVSLLQNFKTNTKIGVVINDLERSKIAYRLFGWLCLVFRLNKISREDGLLSILRGFKKADLKKYCELAKIKKYSVRRKWAFRYQCVIWNL